jgi:hypothetical protein
MKLSPYSMLSLVLAILIFPITYVLSKTFGFIIKSWNPSGVNVHSSLAYIAPIIFFGLAVFTLIAALSIFAALRALKTSKTVLPYLIIVLVVVETIVLITLLSIGH